MKKKDIINLKIVEKVSMEKSIGYYEDRKVLVKGGLVGQEVEVRITKIRKNRIEGSIVEVLKRAENEITPKCKDFGACGGCTFQNITYEDQLVLKEEYVKNLFEKASIKYEKFNEIVPSVKDFSYRNKMEFSFGDREKGGALCLGMHEKGKHHNIVSTEECILVDEDYQVILKNVLNYFVETGIKHYNKFSKEGTLRHLVIRKASYTNEILVNLVSTSEEKINTKEFANLIKSLPLKGSVVGILHTINNSLSDAVIPEEVHILDGRDYIIEECLGLKFKISAFSFFQTNTLGSERLYSVAKDFIGDTKDKVIFDLYCGTGTITQIVSSRAKKVYGIEIVKEAIDSAKQNVLLNNIDNCEFICGDVLEKVDTLKEKADIIILDPPRSGIHKKAIGKILEFSPETFLYISCKPQSLINDLEYFIEAGYKVLEVTPVDMFPQTGHIECVVLLTRG